ncbi:MAG: 2-amino-4-hydroxy-6-hydroxymethyldihydropteridine diphosphokinase [Waddliaceae bacterium]
MIQVYVALGGNIGDSVAVLTRALQEISQISGVFELKPSNFYRTTPVGATDQDDYVNAVCTFRTSLKIKELHSTLQGIEEKLGKVPKLKDAPRVIDLDLLFYGTESYHEDNLQVPHPRWEERMFVLTPLSDLVAELTVPDSSLPSGFRQVDLRERLRNFPNTHNETVRLVKAHR